jgi:hypothetical protein
MFLPFSQIMALGRSADKVGQLWIGCGLMILSLTVAPEIGNPKTLY